LASLPDFQTAKARQAALRALRQAEAELVEAQKQFDLYCGVGISLALASRIGAAERRVERRVRHCGRSTRPLGEEPTSMAVHCIVNPDAPHEPLFHPERW
jgi:hypothetical protein